MSSDQPGPATLQMDPKTKFSEAILLGAARSPGDDRPDEATALVLQLISLEAAGELLDHREYRMRWERDGVSAFRQFSAGTEMLYQQVHAINETLAHLIVARTSPRLPNVHLGELAAEAERVAHPVAARLRDVRDSIDLLTWIGSCRNKAIQHRVANRYLANNGIVLADAFVLARKPGQPSREDVMRARDLLRGLTREYSIPLDEPNGGIETIAYLDLVSHSVAVISPARALPARTVVRQAKQHHLVVSSNVLENIAGAISTVIKTLPEDPSSPVSSHARSRRDQDGPGQTKST